MTERSHRPTHRPSVRKETAAVNPSRRLRNRAVAFMGGLLALLSACPAAAAGPVSAWTVNSLATPTNFSAIDNAMCLETSTSTLPSCDTYTVTATDAGSLATDGSTVTLADTLPAGLTVQRIALYWSGLPQTLGGPGRDLGAFFCNTETVRCSIPSALFSGLNRDVNPDDTLRMDIYVTVNEPGASGAVTNTATVFGGGAPEASTSEQNAFGSTAPGFGVHTFSSYVAGLDGLPDTQAGGHPYELTTRIDFNNQFRTGNASGTLADTSVEDVKDVVVDLPLGFLGSAISAPQCTFAQLSSTSGCPLDTRVGQIQSRPEEGTLDSVRGGIYNMVSEHGMAAEFGYVDTINGSHALYASVVPTPAGYVLRVTSPDIPQVQLTGVVATFFGDPAAKDGSGNTPSAMFTNPALCTGQPLVTAVHVDSWQHSGRFNADGTPDFSDPNWVSATSSSPAVEGCNALQFSPSISAQPETTIADSPSGLTFELKVPQSENPSTLATPPLQNAVVSLPEGLTVNPSSANGLGGCSLAQVGLSASGEPDAAAPHCPDDSKIGTLELETPLLPGKLEGSIYVAKQKENPFDSLLSIYLVVDDATTGVVVKLPGEIKADPQTGQLTAVFDNTPQLPFSQLRTHFFGGQRASLRTPATCGTYTVSSQLTPWSAPESGPPATPQSKFEITSAPGGGPCPTAPTEEPNSPNFEAGTESPSAGAFSPFVLHLRREDGSQEWGALNVTPPPGLLAKLAGTTYCPDSVLAAAEHKSGTEEQASPSCPPSSEVGTVNVGAGAGPAPYYVQGHAYLAGPYRGAPLSLAIVTPAVAGPYDLGTVVVRSALYVDPETTQITVRSDPIPQILDGIPLDVRSIAVKVDRPSFTLNPTDCEALSVGGSETSVLGQTAQLSDRFQVGGCAALPFKPHLALSLKGQTKRTGNPAIKAVLTMPSGNANIARAQVTLPKGELLDNAHLADVCARSAFLAGSCPPSSVYGRAEAITPLLAAPLSGPAYLVSGYPGHVLPDLGVDLGGQIRVLLHGKTDSVHQSLRNTFEVVPDAPVSKFTLELKGGDKSLIENSHDLCGPKAQTRARASFTAQSGKVSDTTPKVATSCRKKHGHHGAHHR